MAIARQRSQAHCFTLGLCIAVGALAASCTEATETTSGSSGVGESGNGGAGGSGPSSKSTSTGTSETHGSSMSSAMNGSGGAGGSGSSSGAGNNTTGSSMPTTGSSTSSSLTTTGGGQGGGSPSCVPADCDDKDACTLDSCAQGTCKHAKVDPNDNDACTLDSCDAKLGVMHTARGCDDKDACTLDSCDPSVGCVTKPVTYFVETFADNNKGWQLGGIGTGTPWEIGPLKPNPTPPPFGKPDPTLDHTPTADNGVAGVSIGNNTGSAPHAPYYLVSPSIDDSAIKGPVFLEFWRFLNSDAPPFMNSTVEVFDGTGWVMVYGMSLGMAVNDADWVRQNVDVSAYKNKSFQVRWGWEVKGAGAVSVSGWNVDDVRLVPSNNCP